jgi:predicted nucleic acid-binding protein
VIADSTFYLVFLKDIDKPLYFKKIVDAHDFLLAPLVDSEIQHRLKKHNKSANYAYIVNNNKITKFDNSKVNLGATIKYFFGPSQIKVGEHEVVGHAFHLLHTPNVDLCCILDDKDARRIVKKRLLALYNILKWTTDFIKDSCCVSGVLEKDECIQIFTDMKKVGSLKVSDARYDRILNEIKSGQPV